MIINSREMMTDFVKNALDGKIPDIFAVYGKVDDNLANAIYEKSCGTLNVKDSYLELSANDLFHAKKHSVPIEEGDIELSLEDIIYSLVNIGKGNVEKAVQRKNGENIITISFSRY